MNKKLLAAIICGVLLIALVAGLIHVNASNVVLKISAPDGVTANIGQDFILPEAVATDQRGNKYKVDIIVKDGDNNGVVVENNSIFIAKETDYKIIYSVNSEGQAVATKQTKIKVVDELTPNIIVKNYTAVVAINDIVKLPDVKVNDASGEEIKPTFSVKDDNDNDVSIKDEAFKVETSGTFKVYIDAQDNQGNKSQKKVLIFVRDNGEIESADREDYLYEWTPSGNTTINFNTEAKYIKHGTGSMKVTSSKVGYKTWPGIMVENPAIKDVSNFYSIYFWVYNDSETDIPLMSLAGDGKAIFGIAIRKQWTLMEVTVDALKNSFYDYAGRKFDVKAFKDFNIFFVNDNKNITLYVDHLYVRKTDNAPHISIDSGDVAVRNTTYTLPVPTIVDGDKKDRTIPYSTVILDSQRNVVSAKSKFKATDKNGYTILYYAKDSDGNEGFKIQKVYVRDSENEIDSFDYEDYLSSVNAYTIGTMLSINTETAYIKDGAGSLKIVGEKGWGTMPGFKIPKPAVKDLTDYKSISFWVYNPNDQAIELWTNWTNLGYAYPHAWTRIELTIEQLEAVSPANSYKASEFKDFTVQYVKPNMDVNFTLYIDSIYANKKDSINIDADAERSAVVNQTFGIQIPSNKSGVTFSYVVYKPDNTKLMVKNNAFTPDKIGQYTILYTAKSANNEGFKIQKVYVRSNANEIESFDSNHYLSSFKASTVGTILGINTDPAFIKDGSGSLKMMGEHGWGTMPSITIPAPAVSNLTGKYSVSFWVYNPNFANIEVWTYWTKLGLAYSHSWTKFELTLDQLAQVSPKGYDITAFKELNILFVKPDTLADYTLYVDSIFVNDTAPLSVNVPEVSSAVKNTQFIVPVPANQNGITYSFSVVKPDKTMQQVKNNKFIPDQLGEYNILYYAKGKGNSGFQVQRVYVRASANEMESFDREDYFSSFEASTTGTLLSLNTNAAFIKDGSASLKITGEHGWGTTPQMTIKAPAVSNLTGKYSLSFWVYNPNSVNIKIWSNWTQLGIAYAQNWTKIEMTVDQIANISPTGSYNIAALKDFSICFEKPDNLADYTLYFDSMFVNDSAPLSINTDDTASTVINTVYSPQITPENGVNYSYSVLTPGNQTQQVINGKFTPTEIGQYILLIRAKGTGNEGFKVKKLFVRGSADEIESFDKDGYLDAFISLGGFGTNISLNKDMSFVKNGTASLKIFGGSNTYPGITIPLPSVRDLTEKYSISFWVYNPCPTDIMLCTLGWSELGKAYARQWSRIEVTVDQLADMTSAGKNYNIANFKDFNIFFAGAIDADTVYIDSLEVNAARGMQIDFPAGYDKHLHGSDYTLPTPAITGGAEPYNVKYTVMANANTIINNADAGSKVSNLPLGINRVTCNVTDAEGIEAQAVYNLMVSSLTTDFDYTSLFTPNSQMTLAENTEATGLYGKDPAGENSIRSVKMTFSGHLQYPAVTIAGDNAIKKSIKFWIKVTSTTLTGDGTTIPICNMTTGAILANAKLNQWVEVEMELGAMSGNTFGFLLDRAPMDWHNFVVYVDGIIFTEHGPDNDSPGLFVPNSQMTLAENTEASGLYGSNPASENNTRSVKMIFGGHMQYPAVTIAGNNANKKSIKFRIKVTSTTLTGDGTIIPISNMTTGATLANAKLNEWVEVELDLGAMNGNTFGFLLDRAPMDWHSLVAYMDGITFTDFPG